MQTKGRMLDTRQSVPLSSVALGTLTRIFVEELGEVAIKLYGGGQQLPCPFQHSR